MSVRFCRAIKTQCKAAVRGVPTKARSTSVDYMFENAFVPLRRARQVVYCCASSHQPEAYHLTLVGFCHTYSIACLSASAKLTERPLARRIEAGAVKAQGLRYCGGDEG